MGKIIRLDTVFTNPNLPVLVDYDYAPIEAEILAYPTLRAFFDAAAVVKSGSNVTQMTDRTGNGRHFVQANTALAPVASTINGMPGVYFDGAREMLSTGLFSGANEQTVNMFVYPTGATGVSQIVLSDRATQLQNFYVSSTRLLALNSGVTLDVPSAPTKLINYIASFNQSAGTSALYGAGGSATGGVGGNTSAPSGDAYLGRWSDSQAGNKYIGHVGHVAIFDEDVSKNSYLRALLDEYARSKYRTNTWPA